MLASYSVAKRLFSSQFIYVLAERDDTAQGQYIADRKQNSEPCALSQGFNLFVGVGKRKPECNL